MQELGEKLKEVRKKTGVTLEECSIDLDISLIELEGIENGNYRIFKDVYELKEKIKNYAKYLGMNVDGVLDDFNDFVFEKTSKISLNDIKSVISEEETPDKISSPYTKIKRSKYDYAPIVLIVVILAFISLVVYLVLLLFNKDDTINRELMNKETEIIYEFTE